MTAVVKFAVVGQRILDEEAASLITTEQLTVLAGKGGVVFAHASVLVELAWFGGNAAEDNADISVAVTIFRHNRRSHLKRSAAPKCRR